MATDVTPGGSASRHDDAALRGLASDAAYRLLFEDAPQPGLVESVDGLVLDVNRAAERLLGGTRDELVGLPVTRITALEAEEVRRRAATALRDGSATFTGTGVRLDGTRFPQSLDVARVDIDGEPLLLVHVRDLTESMAVQAELVQAQKMEAIGTLVAGVAHELNNPLAAIVAFSELIRRDARLPDDMRADAEMLVAEAGRTRRIVSNLLDFARQRPPERHPTALHALIASVVELQSYSLKDGRIAISVDIDDDLPPVELDRSQLQQVLVNLTLNAVEAIRSDRGEGTVSLTARLVPDASPPRVRIVVEDDGPGVPAEQRSRLFTPFFTTKAQGEGTGLGLPVSLGIVAAHGGTLRFEEPEGGRGARFAVELPVHATAVISPEPGTLPAPTPATVETTTRPPSAQTLASSPVRATKRVLVLDDEPSIRAFLAKALATQGIEAVTAASGLDALALARSGDFDAMLCDHRMAGMSGPAVYEALEREDSTLARHFVFMTGDVLNPDLRAFASQRGITLLAKPFDLGTVTDAVQRALDHANDEAQRG